MTPGGFGGGSRSHRGDSGEGLGLSADRKTRSLLLLLLGKGPGGLSALCKAAQQVGRPALPLPPGEGPGMPARLVCGFTRGRVSAGTAVVAAHREAPAMGPGSPPAGAQDERGGTRHGVSGSDQQQAVGGGRGGDPEQGEGLSPREPF